MEQLEQQRSGGLEPRAEDAVLTAALGALGRSGCKLQLVPELRGQAIRKSCPSSYAPRLHRQRLKQESCRPSNPHIRVPKVLAHDNCSFMMSRLPMVDCVDFFERARPEAIAGAMKILFDFVAEEFSAATLRSVETRLFTEKVAGIKAVTPSETWEAHYARPAAVLSRFIDEHGSMPVPLGSCHGDLTLSNVMFSQREPAIGLIDFLDSFIDTPLVDLVKIRQDTRFAWTSMLYPYPHDRAKLVLLNRWLDAMLCDRFAEHLATPAYRVLEIINYLRVAPYMTSPEEHRCVGEMLGAVCAGLAS